MICTRKCDLGYILYTMISLKFFFLFFLWAWLASLACAECSGRARFALASPCRSAIGDARGGAVRFLGRFLSSAAARARAFGIPSPLNVHRLFCAPARPIATKRPSHLPARWPTRRPRLISGRGRGFLGACCRPACRVAAASAAAPPRLKPR